MRWMRGGSFRVLLRKGPLAASASVRLVDQMAAALTAVHRQGLVHGHLKPENILFDNDGNGYLTHIGISSDVRRAKLNAESAASAQLAYLAPEQLRGKQPPPVVINTAWVL